MPFTPKQRTLRSNFTDHSATNNDIILIIEKQKHEIIESFKNDIKIIHDKIDSLESKIQNFESTLKVITKRQNEQEYQLSQLSDEMKNIKMEFTHEILDEIEQRNRRRNNIIICGLGESQSGDLKERSSHDELEVRKVFGKLKIDNIDIKNATRLRKIEVGKKRLLRIKLSSEECKIKLLQCARSLKRFPEYKGVFLNPDRTPLEQRHFTLLRTELKHRKDRGEDVVIFRGRIVERQSLNGNSHFH